MRGARLPHNYVAPSSGIPVVPHASAAFRKSLRPLRSHIPQNTPFGSGRLLLSAPSQCCPFSPRLQPRQQARQRGPSPPHAGPDALAALGTDFLLFLGATVLVVPLFKSANQSPVLGYLFAGLVMGQLGLFRSVEEIEKLSELGVLFLLFEMGLELSVDKLRALAKYAFGLGSLQMFVTTAALTAVALPPGEGVMTKVLEFIGSPSELAKIRTVDEAVVIAVALSLSSSAFVLQLLKERNELETKFGSATLGILLFQDIATVPFLILLPLIEGRGSGVDITDGAALLTQLVPTVLKTLGGIGIVLLGGRTVFRRVFEVVASAKSDEVFIALCLLSVTGASLLTQRLGFSDTLGAFVSGVLLSETNFKAQVEADIQPFRGLLLGLFFVTTGASMDLGLCIREWPTVLGLLVGLLALKASVISIIGPAVGLTKSESLRTGFVLSQGGEFAFVLLALAAQLNVLPPELNKLLIVVVVLSMAATPLLTEAGRRVADIISAQDGQALSVSSNEYIHEAPVLVCGFGDVGQAVANMLRALNLPYVAFDLTVARVQAAQESGFNVLYGDGSRAKVLHAAGIENPSAIAVGYTARQRSVSAVSSLRNAFPDIPILVRAIDMVHASELEEAGATQVVLAEAEAGLAVGTRIAQDLGAKEGTVAMLSQALRADMAVRTHEMALETAAKLSGTELPNAGAVEGSSMRSVYRFDAPRGAWDVPAGGSAASIDDDGSASNGGLLASIFSAIGSTDDTGNAEITVTMVPQRSAGSSSVAIAEGKSGNSNGDREGGSSVVLRAKDGDESLVLPDGSIECPIEWEGQVNDSSSDKNS